MSFVGKYNELSYALNALYLKKNNQDLQSAVI